MSTSKNRSYLPEIDQIRGYAVLLILIYHCFHVVGADLAYGATFDAARHWVIARNPLVAFIAEGHSAVGLFIVLSGFILSVGAIGHQISFGAFIKARILRIYPLVVLLGMVAFHLKGTGFASLVSLLLPINYPNDWGSSFSAMFWAVHVEFQCYLIFPFLITFADRRGTRYLLAIVLLMLLLRTLACMADSGNPRDLAYWTILGRLDQFVLGMIAARLYVLYDWRTKVRPWWFPLFAALAFCMLWAFNQAGGWPLISRWKLLWPDVEGLVWAGFLLSYLAAGRFLPKMIARTTTWFGEISYPVYLVHFPVMFAVMRSHAYIQVTGTAHYDAVLTALLVVLPLTTGLSMLLHLTIEKPFLQLRPRYVGSSRILGGTLARSP